MSFPAKPQVLMPWTRDMLRKEVIDLMYIRQTVKPSERLMDMTVTLR